MRLGIAGEMVPTNPELITAEYAEKLASVGVRTIAARLHGSPREIADIGPSVRKSLASAGLDVAQSSGYNPRLLEDDPDKRASEMTRLEGAFTIAEAIGAKMVLTGCGSNHPTSFYGPSPLNHSLTARNRLASNLSRVADIAKKYGIPLVLECHALTTLGDVNAANEVLDAVNSPWIKVNFDPVNLISTLDQAYNSGRAIRKMWDVLGSHYVNNAHIKDVEVADLPVVNLREVPPGDGILDYAAFFEICAKMDKDAGLIVEHVSRSRVDSALMFVQATARAHSVELL